jgi:hypothetical protein
MRIAMTLLALSLAVAPTGCKKKNKEADNGSAAGSAMVGSDMGTMAGSAMAGSAAGSAMAGSDMGSAAGSAMAGSAADMGAGSGSDAMMAHHAGNCPSTVLGATTKAEVKGKDVIVTITATDKDAVKAIQTRTDALVKQIAAPGHEPGTAHDQKGTHGGTMGLCPVHVPDGGTAKAKHEKDGVAVTITPKDNVDALKTDIDGRIQKAADWTKANIQPGDKGNMGGVGGGKADEGMNRSGKGDGKGLERKKGDGTGGGAGTGGGGGKGTGGGGKGSAKK